MNSLTKAEVDERKNIEESLHNKGRPLILRRLTSDIVRDLIKNTIVSCWHMNEVESMAMWDLYLSGSEGIVIRSTFERLASCFKKFNGKEKGYNTDKTEKELRIKIGMVRYINYDDLNPVKDVPRIMLRRKSFKYEHEVRAVVVDNSFQGDPDHPTRFPKGGDVVPVNLLKLIERVYISPKAPLWFANLVRDVIKRYGFNFSVKQSDLNRDPIY